MVADVKFMLQKTLAKPAGGLLVDTEELGSGGGCLPSLGGRTVFVLDGEVEPVSQGLDCFHEGEVLGQLDETDGIAPGVRAETLEHVPLRMDEERRGVFLTERTQPLPAFSGPFQFHVRGHDLVDWYAGLQVGQVGVLDASHASCYGLPVRASSRCALSLIGWSLGAALRMRR